MIRPLLHLRPGLLLLLSCLSVAACATTGSEPEARVAGALAASPGVGQAVIPAESPSFPRTPFLSGPTAPAGVEPAVEAEVLDETNRARESRGVPALVLRADLTEVARAHALDMAARSYFSHRSPEGRGPGDRAAAHRVTFRTFAENLARVRRSLDPADLAVRGWLASPGHRRNLLDERRVGYRFTGIGVARAPDGTLYITQVFL